MVILNATGNRNRSTANHDSLFADNAPALLDGGALVSPPEKGRRWNVLATTSHPGKACQINLNSADDAEDETEPLAYRLRRLLDLDEFFTELGEDDAFVSWAKGL